MNSNIEDVKKQKVVKIEGKGRYFGECNDPENPDLPNGRGKMTYTNKDVYEGQWKNGKKHGAGVKTNFSDEVGCSTYAGNYCEDKPDGEGTYTWAPREYYKGGWKMGAFHGYGEKSMKAKFGEENDSVYKGEWQDGLPQG